mgnify:CR=1 FL=1
MHFLTLVSTVVNDGELFISESEPAFFADTIGNAAVSTSDFVDKFLNMDFINELFTSYAKLFAVGFAFATVLILLTFGVFKAFSLVRID